MASLLLPAIANALGANSFWMSTAGLVGSLLDQRIFAQNVTQTSEVGKQSDLQIQSSSLGAGIVKGYGTIPVAGNIIWGTKFTEHITTSTQTAGGGKGGGGSSQTVTTTTYSYSISFAIAICRGPISSISEVWADGNEIALSSFDCSIYYGTEDQPPDPFMEGIEGAGRVPAYRGIAYIVFKNFPLEKFGNRIPTFQFLTVFPKNNVAQIVQEICTDAGFVPEDLDVTSISDKTIRGFAVQGAKTFRSQIEALQVVFLFDAMEFNGQVVFKARDFTNVIAVPEEDMGVYETSKPEKAYQFKRAADLTLPKTVKLAYLSSDCRYTDAVVTAKRQVTKSVTDSQLSTNVVLSDAEATQLAEVRLKELWINRTTFETSLSTKYATVQPGTLIETTTTVGKNLLLVTKASYGKPGINKISATAVSRQAYTTTSRTVDPGSPGIAALAPTEVRFEILDIPQLPSNISDVQNILIVAASAEVYYGANLFQSMNGGANYSLLKANLPKGIIGDTTSTLADGDTHTWDMVNKVTVKIITGTLSSSTKDSVLNGANMCVIGNEVLQFLTATLTAANTYELSGLLRGRFGSEDQTSLHSTGDRFVMLTLDNVATIACPSSMWFKPWNLKGGSSLKSVTDASYKTFDFTPQAVFAQPLSPCRTWLERDEGKNITIHWTRRTRGNGDMIDFSDVPLNEDSEKYEIDVMSSNAATATVKRTIAVAAQQVATYSAADQIADFGTIQTRVKLRIYQLSATRGRGKYAEESEF